MLDTVTVDGADDLSKSLRKMADRSGDLEAFYNGPVADLWRDRQADVFTSGRLAPLSPKSVRRKRVHKTDPMVATGALQAATTRYTPVKANQTTAVYGIPRGNPHKWLGHMHANRSGSRPKRDVVPNWTRAEKLKIIDMLADWVVRGRR